MTIEDSLISDNEALGNLGTAGGILNANADPSAVMITNTTITGNEADLNGAGLVAGGSGKVTLRNATVADNTTVDATGGVGIHNTGGDVDLENTIVADNVDQDTGALRTAVAAPTRRSATTSTPRTRGP